MAGYIFLSYSHRDARYAEALASFLAQQGIGVWMDNEISFGDNWAVVIEERLANAAALVVLMSPDADQSSWVHREIDYVRRLGKPILPLLLAGRPFLALLAIPYEDVTSGNMPGPAAVSQLRALTDAPVQPTPLTPDGPTLANRDATKVFISYRRADTAFAAHWLHRELAEWFQRDGALPNDSFFIDVDSINPGRRFRDAVRTAITQCQVLLAIIGDRWLAAETDGLRRIDAPNDMVRQEIELALAQGVTIVPIMISPAVMPDSRLLPETIQEMTEFQGVTIHPERFRATVEFLAPKLKQIIEA